MSIDLTLIPNVSGFWMILQTDARVYVQDTESRISVSCYKVSSRLIRGDRRKRYRAMLEGAGKG
jgi:hypothetical protein